MSNVFDSALGPPAQTSEGGGDNVFSIFDRGGGSDAAGARIRTAISPDDAQKAIGVQRDTGFTPSPNDLDNFHRMQVDAQNIDIVHNDPHLTDYVNSHPMAASLSADDWPALSKASQAMRRLAGGTAIGQAVGATLSLGRVPTALNRAVDAAPTIMNAAIDEGWEAVMAARKQAIDTPFISEESRKAYPNMAKVLDIILTNPMLTGLRTAIQIPRIASDVGNIAFAGAIGAAHGAIHEAARQFGATDNQADSIAREAAAMFEAEAGGLTGRGHIAEIPTAAAEQVLLHARAREAMRLAKPYLDRGEEPPRGLHPLIDQGHAIQALIDEKNHGEALKAVQATDTWKREPEFNREQFLSQFPNSHIEIPAEKLAPYAEKLDWIPNLQAQIEAGIRNGGDVEIPRDLWLTNIDPEIAKELNDSIRFRPGGFTKEEAKEALKPAELEEKPPPVVAGEDFGQGPWATPKEIPEVEAVRRVAGLETPSFTADLVDDVAKIVGQEGRDWLPADATPYDESLHGKVEVKDVDMTPTHHFPISSLLQILDPSHLTDGPRVLFDFYGERIAKLAGDTSVWVVPDAKIEEVVPGAAAFYDWEHQIFMPESMMRSGTQVRIAHVAMEEASHAATAAALSDNKGIHNAVELIRLHTKAWLSANAPELRKAFDYALSNVFEMVAWAQSHPGFQKALMQVPLTDSIRKRVGLDIAQGYKSVWEGMRQKIRELWEQATGKKPNDSVMDAMFRMGEQIELRGKREGLVATGTGILPSEATVEDQKIFQTSKALGMSESYYRKLYELAKDKYAKDQAYSAERLAAREREHQTEEWKNNEREVSLEARDAVLHRRDIAADQFLRTGELFGKKYTRIRLNQDDLTPEQKAALDPEHYSQRGILPDILAQTVGFQSGDQMIQALANLSKVRETEGLTAASHISQLAKVETERLMQARYGKLEDNIAQAMDHILSTNFDNHYNLLHEDTIRYMTLTGRTELGFTKDDIVKQARFDIMQMRHGATDSGKLMERTGNLGRAIEKSMAEGEFEDAFRMSQQREVTFQQAKLARKIEKARDAWDRRAKTYRKREPTVVPIEWSNAIQDILKRTGEPVNRGEADIQREYQKHTPGGDLAGFVADYIKSDKFEVDPDNPRESTLTVAPFLLDSKFKKDVDNMSNEEFLAAHNSVESLHEHGKMEKFYNTDSQTWQKAELIGQLKQILKDTVGKTQKSYPFGDKGLSPMQAYWASLLQMESLWKRLDLGDPEGLFHTSIYRPTSDASYRRGRLEKETNRMYNAIPDFDNKASLNKQVENSIFYDPLQEGGELADQPKAMTLRNWLAVLQNVGNYSNFDKLGRGYKVYGVGDDGRAMRSQHVEEFQRSGYKMAMNDPIMNALFKVTTKKDWDRAQAIGDIFEHLYGLAERMMYSLGARPGPRVELQPIETPFGTYKGWYHPLIYDAMRGGESKKLAESIYEDGAFYKAATAQGYQKPRTGYAAPIYLNFDPIPFRMKQMVNDIAMRPVVTELSKIFGDKDFRAAMTTSYGKQYTALLDPYLRDIAGQRKYSNQLQQTGTYWAEWFYQNLVSTMIGLNPGTVFKHLPTAIGTSIRQVGAKRFLEEFSQMAFHSDELGQKNWDFAMENSQVLPLRARNWYETIGGAHFERFEKGTTADTRMEAFRERMIKIGASPVAYSDMISAMPTWLATYKDAMRAGKEHLDAVYLADNAVVQAHGSTQTISRPALMRGGVMARAIAPFYTFFNEMLQRQYEMAWRAKLGAEYAKDGDYKASLGQFKIASASLFAYVIFPAIVEQIVSPQVFDKDETYLRKGVSIIGRDIASSFPLIRDAVDAATSGRDPTIGLYTTAFKAFNDFYRDVNKGEASLNRAHRGKLIKHTATLAGVLTGLSSAQQGRWAEFAHDYATGQQRPRTGGDWYRAFRFGQIKEQTH